MPIEGYEGQSLILQLQIEKYGGKRRSPMTIWKDKEIGEYIGHELLGII